MAPAKWCLSGCLGLISAWGETSVQLFRESPWGIRSLNNSMSGWGPTFIKMASTVLPSVSTPLIMRPCGSSQEVESVFHSWLQTGPVTRFGQWNVFRNARCHLWAEASRMIVWFHPHPFPMLGPRWKLLLQPEWVLVGTVKANPWLVGKMSKKENSLVVSY